MKNLHIIILFLISLSAEALFEFNGQYGLDRQRFGESQQNTITSTTYSGSVALYLYNYTAIELNYGNTETLTKVVNTAAKSSEDYDLLNKTDKVVVESFGIGIRQAFANRKARFVPTLSIGYAKRFAKNSSSGRFRFNSDDSEFSYRSPTSKLRTDSVFATLGLNIKLTRMISLRASAQTIFKAFEFNEAQYNMKYLVGFSWYL
jgi:hypothetical protein